MLLTRCLLLLPLFVAVCVWSLFYNAQLSVRFSCAPITLRKREMVALIIMFLLSCDYKCSVHLPRGAVGWPAVCDCVISCLYSLTLCRLQAKTLQYACMILTIPCLNIGVTHVFSCINICRVPKMLFEHEAKCSTSPEGPGKC